MRKRVTRDLAGLSRFALEAALTAATRRGEELILLIRESKARAREAFFEMGEALLELEKKNLWRVLGYETFAVMLKKNGLISRAQAFKLMAIARELPRSAALGLGREKSYALICYARANATRGSVTSVLATGVRVDGRRRPVRNLTVRELQQASRRPTEQAAVRHRAPQPTGRSPSGDAAPVPPPTRALCRAGASSLSRILGERIHAEPAEMRGGWAVRVTLSVAAWEALRRKLAKAE